jgi:hypothetical protein
MRQSKHVFLHCCETVLISALFVLSEAASAQAGLYDWAGAPYLCPGVRNAYVHVETPRPMDIHCVQADTLEPGLKFHTTGRGPGWVENSTETLTQTTRDFMRVSRSGGIKMVVAINANAWNLSAWFMQTPADLLGFAVSDGVLVSPGNNYPSLIAKTDGTVSITPTTASTPVDTIHTAASGFGYCLTNGTLGDPGGDLAPRTGIGVSEDSRYVLLMVIDGRQTASQGATWSEVGAWLQHFGAYNGINMDGGGSTTLARWEPNAIGDARAVLMNSPVGSGSGVGTERWNGNNLGIVFNRLEIVQQPRWAMIENGVCHRLTVEIGGATGIPHFVWTKDNNVLTAAPDEPWLDLCPATLNDSGVYACKVTDDASTVQSQTATVQVVPKLPLAWIPLSLVLLFVGVRVRARSVS